MALLHDSKGCQGPAAGLSVGLSPGPRRGTGTVPQVDLAGPRHGRSWAPF